ncbi:MAG: NAD(P)H-dependent flavin oxidoreductase [Thermosulfidibacteraceae bacterium]|jgi:NAD(P)H-dependent flavin oxidoreductase YrpB (nitropropane dioxygenase family)
MNPWPRMVIGEFEIEHPIIQGGMAVGVSLHRLAGSVSRLGALGVVAGSAIGLLGIGRFKNLFQADVEILKEEIRLAKEISEGRPVGVNIMVAVNRYEEKVIASIEAGADFIITGAGLPLNLPELAKGKKVALLPIVSSLRAADIIVKRWWERYRRLPDAFVLEGPLAGGHLGFSEEDLVRENGPSIYKLTEELASFSEKLRVKYGYKIPVISAGGIFRGWEIRKIIEEYGASGVQMATRFVATHECDVHENFKRLYVKAKKEDVTIIKSPVGMPARAIKTVFVERIMRGEARPINCRYLCLKPCDPKKVPYCIAEALLNAQRGDLESGLFFCGERVYEVDRIVSVGELLEELKREYMKQ